MNNKPISKQMKPLTLGHCRGLLFGQILMKNKYDIETYIRNKCGKFHPFWSLYHPAIKVLLHRKTSENIGIFGKHLVPKSPAFGTEITSPIGTEAALVPNSPTFEIVIISPKRVFGDIMFLASTLPRPPRPLCPLRHRCRRNPACQRDNLNKY